MEAASLSEQSRPTGARNPSAAPSRARGRFVLLAIILTLLTIVRLIGLGLSDVGLFYDEAQYWSWAQDPDLGYPSKPPLLAWLLFGVHHVCGDSEWCVRSPSPIIYAATCLAIYGLARRLYDERDGFWAAILAAFTPGIVFSTRVISTDIPLLLFFTLALLAYIEILQSAHSAPKRWGILLGLCIGLGMLSKYAMIYLVPGMVLAGFVDPRARRIWREPAIWLGGLIATVIVAPNLAWNIRHSFATVRHTGGLVLDEPFAPNLGRGLEFLASQLAVIGPVTFAVMMIAAIRFRSQMLIAQDRLMLAFFVSPIVPVTLFAIYSRAFANWAAPAVVPAIVGCAAILLRSDRRVWLWASIALGITFQSAVLVTDAIASKLPPQIGTFSNPYNLILVWRGYAENIGALAERVGAQAIAAEDRRTFSTLRYYLRDQPQTVVSWDNADEPAFDLRHKLDETTPQPVLFVTACPDAERLKVSFSAVEPLGIQPSVPEPRAPRFRAFKLSQARTPIGPLEPCKIPPKQGSVSETRP